MFVQLFAFCLKILCELRLHVAKVSGEELAPGIEILGIGSVCYLTFVKRKPQKGI